MLVEFLISLAYWGATLLVGVITALIIYTRWNYGTLEKVKGLKAVVKPAFIGGSDPFMYKNISWQKDVQLTKEHGKVYGFYEGRQPQIYISDVELIRLIFVKDFDYFQNKRIMDFGHEYINEMMDILPYEKWKVVRNYLSPSLTTSKIKTMSYQMLECISEWFDKIKIQASESGNEESYEFVPKIAFTSLTTDVIARCAFGTKINAFENPDNLFVKNLKRLVFEEVEIGPAFSLLLSFPFLVKLVPFMPHDVMNYFGDLLKNILDSRRQNSKERINDFVDVLNDMMDKCETPEYKKHGIRDTTVICQAIVFLLAGFETTATTLTILSYRLSTNPDIQDKLIEEVDSYMKRHDGKIEHETIGELVYLAACMNETLRMNAPLIRLERVCQKDWIHESSGLEIKKGMVVQVPVFAVHYNEEYFPDPHSFKPERFLAENKDKMNPYAYLSFGQGPHNCIGMRFAKEEIQMTMASILKDFRFQPCADSKLVYLPGRIFLNNYENFHLKMCKRSK